MSGLFFSSRHKSPFKKHTARGTDRYVSDRPGYRDRERDQRRDQRGEICCWWMGSLGVMRIGWLDPLVDWIPSRELTYPPKNGILKMMFLFPRWDMLIPRRVYFMMMWTLFFFLVFPRVPPPPFLPYEGTIGSVYVIIILFRFKIFLKIPNYSTPARPKEQIGWGDEDMVKCCHIKIGIWVLQPKKNGATGSLFLARNFKVWLIEWPSQVVNVKFTSPFRPPANGTLY